MKVLSRTLLIMLAMAAFVAWGCGDDDDGNGTTDTIGGDTAGGDTAGGDTAGGDTNTGDNGGTDTTPTPTAYCANAADLTAHATAAATCTDPKTAACEVADHAGACGQGCVGNADEKQCSIDCLVPLTNISNDCAGCYGDSVLCAIKECIAQCIADPNADVCKQCREDKGCTPGFFTCSGFEDCDDTIDNNGDGTVDCDDPICKQTDPTTCPS